MTGGEKSRAARHPDSRQSARGPLPRIRPEGPRTAHVFTFACRSCIPSVAVRAGDPPGLPTATHPRGHAPRAHTLGRNTHVIAPTRARRGRAAAALIRLVVLAVAASALSIIAVEPSQAPAERRRGQDQAEARPAAGQQGRGRPSGSASHQADLSSAAKIKDWNERGQAVYDALTAAADAEPERDQARCSTTQGRRTRRSGRPTRSASTRATRPWSTSSPACRRWRRCTRPSTTPSRSRPRARTCTRSTPSSGASPTSTPTTSGTQFGVTGEGITVASIDTGVQYDHPALVDQYRGNNGDGTFNHNYNWFDAAGTLRRRTLRQQRPRHPHHGHDGRRRRRRQPDRRRARREVDRRQRLLPLRRGADRLRRVDARADRPRGREPRRHQAPEHHQQLVGHARSRATTRSWRTSQVAWAASGIFGASGPTATAARPARPAARPAAGSSTTRSAPTTSTTRSPASPRAAPARTARSSRTSPPPASTSAPACPAARYGALQRHLDGLAARRRRDRAALVGGPDADRRHRRHPGAARRHRDRHRRRQCGGTADDNNVFGEGRLDALALLNAAPIGDTGTLAGTVTDAATGDPLGGATVDDRPASPSRTLTTGDDGTLLGRRCPPATTR